MKQPNVKTPRKASTLRLAPELQARVALLVKLLKVSQNQFVNEAVQTYVHQQTAEVAMNLEETLKLLKANQAKDPEFESAIAAFAESESRHAKDDPAEGKAKFKVKRGPLQAKVRGMLSA